ncbi:MAG: hypothetical protein ACI4RT_03140 [Candidatus Spyradenecus sp.]
MEILESTALPRATVAQMATAASLVATLPTQLPQASLTVTTAFRTVEVPIGSGNDPALAVEIAKLIILTDLLRETPEEREKRLRESEQQQRVRESEQREAREALQRQLDQVLEAARGAALEAQAVRERVCEILGALDAGAWQLLSGHILRVADAQQVRNVVQAWQSEALEAALIRSQGEALWQLAEATLNALGEDAPETIIPA